MPKGQKTQAEIRTYPAQSCYHPPLETGVCVDLIGTCTVKAKDGTKLDFMCLTMIDPATSWFEITELPHSDVKYTREGKELIAVIGKTSTCIARLFNKRWLARYPRPQSIL